MIKYIIHSVLLISVYAGISSEYATNTQSLDTIQLDKKPLTFEKDIKPIMDSKCGGVFCHHGKPSVFTKYAVVQHYLKNGLFEKKVLEDKTMPKREKLSEIELSTIKNWIESGAIEK